MIARLSEAMGVALVGNNFSVTTSFEKLLAFREVVGNNFFRQLLGNNFFEKFHVK